MKKYIISSLLSILLFSNIQAQNLDNTTCCMEIPCGFKADKNYVKVFGGVNYLDLKSSSRVHYHSGAVVSLSLGRYVCSFLRAEVEVCHRNNPISYKVHNKETFYSSTTATMVNVLWDLPICQYNIKPFIGGGIGTLLREEMYFTWQGIFGLNYSVTSKTVVSLEYKVFKSKDHACNHSVGLGLSYKFPCF